MTSRITVVAGLLILLAWGTVFAAESAAPADKPQPVFLWPGGACGSNRGDDRSQYAFSIDAPAARVYSLFRRFSSTQRPPRTQRTTLEVPKRK